jgi:hypothetical protein
MARSAVYCWGVWVSLEAGRARERTDVWFWRHNRRRAPLLHGRVAHGTTDARGQAVARCGDVRCVVAVACVLFVARVPGVCGDFGDEGHGMGGFVRGIAGGGPAAIVTRATASAQN